MKSHHLIIAALLITVQARADDGPGICRSSVHAPETTVQCPATPLPAHVGARSDPGNAYGPIDVWNHCRYIANITTQVSIFVPFRTAFEWAQFVANYPRDTVNLRTCAKPHIWETSSQDGAQHGFSNLPYDPTGTIYKPPVISFAHTRTDCNSANQCNTASWNETHTLTFEGLNSDIVTPSWKLVSDVIDNPIPPLNPPPDQLASNTDVTCHGGKDSTCADQNGGTTTDQHGGNYPNQNDGTDVTAGMARDSGSNGGGGSNTTGSAGAP